ASVCSHSPHHLTTFPPYTRRHTHTLTHTQNTTHSQALTKRCSTRSGKPCWKLRSSPLDRVSLCVCVCVEGRRGVDSLRRKRALCCALKNYNNNNNEDGREKAPRANWNSSLTRSLLLCSSLPIHPCSQQG